jgi:hypothetical protein
MSVIVSSTPNPSITSLTATGVVSMLSASPLSICPHDFIDIDPVCCPRYVLKHDLKQLKLIGEGAILFTAKL